MIRKLRSLGLVLVAVFALGALTASTASAVPQFTSDVEPTTIVGGQAKTHEFKLTGLAVTCKVINFFAVMPKKTETGWGIAPEYETCTATAGVFTVNAKFTGFNAEAKCSYAFYANETVDLLCNAGSEVTIDAGPCVVHIPEQKGLGKVTYSNEKDGGGNHTGTINASINITGIKGTHTDGLGCPFEGGGAFNNATMTGETTFYGEDKGGKKTNITYDA